MPGGTFAKENAPVFPVTVWRLRALGSAAPEAGARFAMTWALSTDLPLGSTMTPEMAEDCARISAAMNGSASAAMTKDRVKQPTPLGPERAPVAPYNTQYVVVLLNCTQGIVLTCCKSGLFENYS